jgi:iron complex outermembrane receptor protein
MTCVCASVASGGVQAATPVGSASGAGAQPEAVMAAEPTAAGSPNELSRVVVTANPLGSKDVAAPVSVLQGPALFINRGTTLGETLAGLPGVSATQFGPNSSRPVIRGLDGDRVRVMSNGAVSFDASSLSFDHAVPIDPLLIDRLEVVRGPAALIYGGSAVGGVINAIDNRIPLERLSGWNGVGEVRLGGANAEKGTAMRLDGGQGPWAIHVDAFMRDTSDLSVPSFFPVVDGEYQAATRRVANSASETRGGSAGAAYFVGGARVGFSVDSYNSRYGVVVEPDVGIRMNRDHVGSVVDWKAANGPIRAVKAQLNHTDYKHEEVKDDGEVGTTFKTRGSEGRLELEHMPIGGVRGMIGFDMERSSFSAVGEEAFVPNTQTRREGLFLLEEMPWSGGVLSAGLRFERVTVSSDGDEPGASEERFGSAMKRQFDLRSASVSNVYKLSPEWSVNASLSHSERAPTSFELYANGVHVATAAYEVGDFKLPSERGQNLDFSMKWQRNGAEMRLGAFQSNFSRFISMDATGEEVEVELDGEEVHLPEYRFNLVRARLSGIEFEAKTPIPGAPWGLGLSTKLDFTQADNLTTNEPLPRVAPLRAHLGLDFRHGKWAGHLDLEHASRQGRVPSYDTPTAAYTLLNFSINQQLELGPLEGLWFVKLGNITNALAYNASSIQTVRGMAPLAGRSLKAGLRLAF